MARIASETEYMNLEDTRIDSIVKVLKEFKYSDDELREQVFPFVAQWLHDNNVTIESTCLIISSIIDIEPIQKIIDDIYNPDTLLPPFRLSQLQKFLSKKEFDKLESVVNVKELKGSVEGWIDNSTSIQTNFTDKSINHIVHKTTKDGKPNNKISYVVNAVPSEVVVYDSEISNLGRSFKTTWVSKESNRKWSIQSEYGGATIKEISSNLIDAGYCPQPRLVESAITCMISSMIQNDMVIFKTGIDNTGVYYNVDEEFVTVVDLDYSEPTNEEKAKALQVLEQIKEFYTDNEKVFVTVFKWGLMSVFSYSMKMAGNKMEWLYLKGTSQAGKSTLAKIMLYLYGVPQDKGEKANDLGGSSFDSPYKIGINVSKDCTMRVINEPAGVFEKPNNCETIKNCIDYQVARSKQLSNQYRNINAFSPVIFTANQAVPDEEALINRMYILSFYHKQRKTEEQKELFKETFNIDIPTRSPLTALNVFGRFAIREIMFEPRLLEENWKRVADILVTRFYESIGTTAPDWLLQWEESETINEFDESIREDIRTFFLDEINGIRRRGLIRDEYGKVKTTLDMSEVSDVTHFEDDVWDMINTNVFNWCIPHIARGEEKVICLTQTFRKELKKHLNYNDNLKSLGQILNWEYANVRFKNGSQKKCIKISLDEFLEFVYPRVGE